MLIKQAGDGNPYPHKFHVSMSMPEYVQKFGSLESAEQLKDSTVSVAGAVAVPLRQSGTKVAVEGRRGWQAHTLKVGRGGGGTTLTTHQGNLTIMLTFCTHVS